jgi:O-antigen/teichoic acid export membrane protein
MHAFWTVIGTLLRFGGNLITLPLVLSKFSKPEMGLYFSFLAVSSAAFLLDFGFASTITRNVSYAFGGAEKLSSHGMPQLASSGKPNWLLVQNLRISVSRFYYLLGLAAFLVLVIIGGYYIHGLLLKSGLDNQNLFCWFFYSACVSYSFAISCWQHIIMGLGELEKFAKIQVIAYLCGVIILFISITIGLGLWSYGLSALCSAMVCHVLYKNVYCKKIIHDGDGSSSEPADFDSEIIKALWPMAWRQGLVMVGTLLIQKSNTLICSSRIDLETTAQYGLTLSVLTILFQVGFIPMTFSWPEICRLRVQNKIQEIRNLFFPRLAFSIILSLLGIVFLAFLGNCILQFLNSNTYLLSAPLLTILALILLLEYHYSQYGSLVLTNNENPFVVSNLVTGISIVLISYFSVNTFGLASLIFSQGIVQLAWSNWWVVLQGLKTLQVK